jgi:hypothetical protein
MLVRTVQLAAPSIAMAVVGFAMFGPGAVRSFDGAQVWGGPTEGARRLSWRVLGVERFRGIDSTKDLGAVVVRATTEAGAESTARCRTRRDGTCDVELAFENDVRGAVHVEITAQVGTSLASGNVIRDRASWDAGPPHPTRVVGASRGDLAIEVRARRGAFAAPFRDELVVTVERGASTVPGAEVTLHADGADVSDASGASVTGAVHASPRGEATFTLVPRTHLVDLGIEAASLGLGGTWNGTLPVIPGAVWLDPAALESRRIRVVSPVPRELVYATLSSRSLRLWGGVIPVSPDPTGYASGEIGWPLDQPLREPLWLTLSSDPRALGAGTIGWPVAHDQGELRFRDWMLLDGMPDAERRDAARRGRARVLAAAALGAAAVIEGVLLAWGSRANDGSDAPAKPRSWVWLVVAIATVALAFAALGLAAMWKTG